MTLTEADKKRILDLAAAVIVCGIRGVPLTGESEGSSGSVMDLHCGVFVSIYIDNKLRGCIGTFSEEEPLGYSLKRMALSAATCDSRFEPVHSEELGGMTVEVSVLSPRVKIRDPSEIEIGKHGIYIQSATGRGTLLPQVAVKQNWSVEQFLGYCSKYKAGLGWTGWKKADIFIYEAIVFRT